MFQTYIYISVCILHITGAEKKIYIYNFWPGFHRGDWKNWLKQLRVYFKSNYLTSYTYLACLTIYQLIELLESDSDISGIPLTGILACARYHIKVSTTEMVNTFI